MKVVKVYALRGFVVWCVSMEMKFESVKANAMVPINTTAAREHVREIK